MLEDLTKFPHPLIIKLTLLLGQPSGMGVVVLFASAGIRRTTMRVHVYKDDKGDLSAFVEPSPGKGRPPVLLQGITEENVVRRVLPAVEEMRGPRTPRKSTQPQRSD